MVLTVTRMFSNYNYKCTSQSIAQKHTEYGIDDIIVMFLTPLPSRVQQVPVGTLAPSLVQPSPPYLLLPLGPSPPHTPIRTIIATQGTVPSLPLLAKWQEFTALLCIPAMDFPST